MGGSSKIRVSFRELFRGSQLVYVNGLKTLLQTLCGLQMSLERLQIFRVFCCDLPIGSYIIQIKLNTSHCQFDQKS